MSIYPNPTNGLFTVYQNPGVYNLRIYDLIGKEVFSQSFMEANSQLDSSSWPKGIYFVEALEQTNQVLTQVKLLMQ